MWKHVPIVEDGYAVNIDVEVQKLKDTLVISVEDKDISSKERKKNEYTTQNKIRS